MFLKVPGIKGAIYTELSALDDIEAFIKENYGISDFWSGTQYYDGDEGKIASISVRLRLPGGKGGFGSNLRAQGNKMSARKRLGDNDACRDLSGRRIRTLNQTRLIEEYLKRKPEIEMRREKEIGERMRRDIEAANKKPVFSDPQFMKSAKDSVDGVESAVYAALISSEDEDLASCSFVESPNGKDNVKFSDCSEQDEECSPDGTDKP